MAEWTESWKPQYAYRQAKEWNTLISTFESGEEQRRSKRAVSRARFEVQFNGLAETTANLIKSFYDARLGAYGVFNFPSYGEVIKGSRLECFENTPNKDTITDTSEAFVAKGFDADHGVWIAGSTAGNNGGYYEVYSVAAGTITLDADQDIDDESANTGLIVYKSYHVRFVADSLDISWITSSVCQLNFALIEVI